MESRGSSRVANPQREGTAAALGTMIILGSLFASADAIERYPIATGQAIRCALATFVLAIVARKVLMLPALRDLVLILLLSLTGVIGYNVAILLAVREADPSVVGVIVSCLPVVVALGSSLVAGRLPSIAMVGAALLVAAGATAVQYSGESASLLGLLFAGGALVLEASFAFLAVPLLERMKPTVVATYTCAFAVPICAAAALLLDEWSEVASPSLGESAALLHLGILVTPIAFALWYVAIDKLGVERASLFFGVLPITVLASAALLGASELPPSRIVGMCAVGVGIVLGLRARATMAPRVRPSSQHAT